MGHEFYSLVVLFFLFLTIVFPIIWDVIKEHKKKGKQQRFLNPAQSALLQERYLFLETGKKFPSPNICKLILSTFQKIEEELHQGKCQ